MNNFSSILETLFYILVIMPLYFIWTIIRSVFSFIWQILKDIGRGVREHTVKFLSYLLFILLITLLLNFLTK